VTTRNSFGHIHCSVKQELQVIQSLYPESAVELFLNQTNFESVQNIPEVVELVKMDKDFPIADHLPEVKNVSELTPALEQKLAKKIKSQSIKLEKILKDHELFKQFFGNPFSINLLAFCFNTPATKSLTKVYQLVREGKLAINSLEEDLNVEMKQTKGGKDKRQTNENSISLQLSMQATICMINEHSQDAESLYYFLGLLPDGILVSQLRQVWTYANEDIEKSVNILKQFHFIEESF